jgi:DNA topoisomerase I
MSNKILVIVESPAKAKKIQKILGSNYIVMSSIGHIRNLKGKNEGVEVDKDFKPVFEISKDKRGQYNKLKTASSNCSKIILATDEDREGEAIAWHLAVLLKVNLKEKNRITFNEITKKAIMKAVTNPRKVDMDLVNAQKSRQIEDYIIGYELSPLTKKFVNGKSAGRVQSSVNKMVCQREEKINNFKRKDYFHTTGTFNDDSVKAKLNKKIEGKDEISKFIENCIDAKFIIKDLNMKECKRKPPAPFTTSTAQIEIGKRFKVPVKMIMNVLQNLYQDGKITYHRTDSTALSNDIMKEIKGFVNERFGKKYLKMRKYNTKTKCAQEAHEAIRPTSIQRENLEAEYDDISSKIYRLIWKRTVASQMSDMEYEKYTMNISISNRDELFIANAEKVLFDGYTRLYNDKIKDEDADADDEEPENSIFTGLKKGDVLKYTRIICKQKMTNPVPRFTEPTLVSEMKKLGIGRPSTYASMISKVQERKYVEKKNIPGEKMEMDTIELYKDKVKVTQNNEMIGKEKGKLMPTELGMNNYKFLEENFKKLLEYKYTAGLEEELDKIANGNEKSLQVLKRFYGDFHPIVSKLRSEKCDNKSGGGEGPDKRLVGKDIGTGKNIYAYEGRYGQVLQVGENDDKEKRYVQIDKHEGGYNVDSINEIEANNLTQFPKNLGKHEGNDIIVTKGKYGYYLKHNGSNHKIKEGFDQFLSLENAIECLNAGGNKKLLKSFGKFNVRDVGKGPFIQYGSRFASIPCGMTVDDLNEEKCRELIGANIKMTKPKGKKKFTKKKSSYK